MVYWGVDPVLRKTVPPYTQVTPKTVSKWLTTVIMETGGENQAVRMGHSTRGHAASAAFTAGLKIADIMAAAEWRSESVFRQYYFHPQFNVNFGRAVLGKS